ncbi:glycosyltransferase [Halosquirtibacter xylanolyticus]|uniref:glycosyltransferase n=1 Tax=Halosquirtibacter xylanolyticus TaxID=3374599 RepID=UPI0037483671|nr:glycosyltransferase [Prolixibacteraceae bacterium]
MMPQLSVCIPIYNRNISLLVTALVFEIERYQLPVNVILLDDASQEKFSLANRQLEGKHVTYELLPENIGRARIRNLFLQKTQAPLLVFIDCDSIIMKKDYIRTYLGAFDDPTCKIIYGGRRYPSSFSCNKRLEGLYGNYRVANPAVERKVIGNRAFLTNNFAIRRTVLETHPFDNSLCRYGYEDMLFQNELTQSNIEVIHIDNPVLNSELDLNKDAIRKMELATQTLKEILVTPKNQSLREEMKLMNYYDRLNQNRFTSIIGPILICLAPVLRCILIVYPTLFFMDIYKLALLFRYKIEKPQPLSCNKRDVAMGKIYTNCISK